MVNGLHLYSAFIQSAVQCMTLIHPFTHTFTHQRRSAAMQGTNQLVRSNRGLQSVPTHTLTLSTYTHSHTQYLLTLSHSVPTHTLTLSIYSHSHTQYLHTLSGTQYLHTLCRYSVPDTLSHSVPTHTLTLVYLLSDTLTQYLHTLSHSVPTH